MIDGDFVGEELFKDIPCDFDNIFGIHMGAILQTANNKQKDIPPLFSHLNPINITATDIEETSDIFEDLDKNEPELIQRQLNTRPVIDDALFPQRGSHMFLSLFELGFS